MTSSRGDSLIEVVVAIAIVSVIILALIRVTTISINNATFAKNQATATNYAREAMEDARRLKEAGPSTFFVAGSCSYSSTPIAGTAFSRSRTCSLLPGALIMDVIVQVAWTDALGSHESKLETHLTKWN